VLYSGTVGTEGVVFESEAMKDHASLSSRRLSGFAAQNCTICGCSQPRLRRRTKRSTDSANSTSESDFASQLSYFMKDSPNDRISD
jgi:hypothetical protein